jgi:hypothetical protein
MLVPSKARPSSELRCRRMSDLAAHLVDRVLPHVPTRQ